MGNGKGSPSIDQLWRCQLADAAKRADSLQRRLRFAQAFVLGDSLPESGAVLPGEWRVEVAATCPACGGHLVASAVFEGRVLLEFALVADA
jgi:hypothetical protein